MIYEHRPSKADLLELIGQENSTILKLTLLRRKKKRIIDALNTGGTVYLSHIGGTLNSRSQKF